MKNLFTGGSIWTLRIANNPYGELRVSSPPMLSLYAPNVRHSKRKATCW